MSLLISIFLTQRESCPIAKVYKLLLISLFLPTLLPLFNICFITDGTSYFGGKPAILKKRKQNSLYWIDEQFCNSFDVQDILKHFF